VQAHRTSRRTNVLRRNINVKRLLARLIELVHGAGLAEFLRELRGGLGRSACLAQKSRELTRCDGAIIVPACLGRGAQRLLGGAQLRLTETVGRNVCSRRQRGERQDVAGNSAFDVKLDRRRKPAERERRIGRKARLHHRGFGDAEFVVGRLKPLVVQKRNLNRRVH